MTEFTPKTYGTGDTFQAADETEVERELDEQEAFDADPEVKGLHDVSADGYIKRQSGLIVPIAAIPKADLATAVQTSLGLADTSLQPHTGTARTQEWESTTSTAVDTGWVAIPAGAYGLRLNMVQPGNGGGSGRRGAAATVRCGGGGGGGGGIIRSMFIPAAALSATEYRLIIPRPGIGGAAVTTDNNNGANGALPAFGASPAGASYTHFQLRDATTTVVFSVYIWPGASGVGGLAGGAMATAAGGYGLSNLGGNGSVNGLTGGAGVGAANSNSACGGAQGGGITSADVAGNGGAGGWNPATTTAVPAGGIVGGASPTDGSDVKMTARPGNGGSGGAASVTAAAQAGRTPVGYGGGGGGGGASLNGFASGAGGNGGPGYASVEWVYG